MKGRLITVVVVLLLLIPSVAFSEYLFWIGYTATYRDEGFYVKSPNVHAANAIREGDDAIWLMPVTVRTTEKMMRKCMKDGFPRFKLSNGEACCIGKMNYDGKFQSYGNIPGKHEKWLKYMRGRK